MATADPEAELERALKETIAAITDACVARLGKKQVPVTVLQSAKQEWRDHYHDSYKHAIEVEHRTWDGDKAQVLDRAKQVGYLAAYFATIMGIYYELLRAGVLPMNGHTQPGQDIFLESVEPVIGSVLARAAACYIDCDPAKLQIEWVWCPPPSEAFANPAVDLLVSGTTFTRRNAQAGSMAMSEAEPQPA